MSLIIAAAKGKTAIIGGDKRSMTFLGDCSELEEELYSGKIKTDEELLGRAREGGASLQVSDGREKVWRRGDVLVGEVTEISQTSERRRRIYIVPGAYILADITGSDARVTGRGKVACMVLGNRFAQELASQGIKNAGGRIDESTIEAVFTNVAERTPSVSKEHCILSTDVEQWNPEAAVLSALREDCQRCGWRLCDRQ